MHGKSLLLTVTVATLLAAQPTDAASTVRYQVTDLGYLFQSSDNVVAQGMNNNGMVVGQVGTRGFCWDPTTGTMTSLGYLGGWGASSAFAVNDSGVVVGYSTANPDTWRATRWMPDGTKLDLGDLPGGYSYSGAVDINNSGWVAGWGNVVDSPSRTHGFVWNPGTQQMVDIGTLNGVATDSYAMAINNQGWVLGESRIPTADGNLWRTFLRNPSSGVLSAINGYANTLDVYLYDAVDLNDSLQVVGTSQRVSDGQQRAYFWDVDQPAVKMGELPGMAQYRYMAIGLNASAQAVGYATFYLGSGMYDTVPFVWSQAQGMRDLRTLVDFSAAGYTLAESVAINDAGQIVCLSTNAVGYQRSLLLTPYNAGSVVVTTATSSAHLLGGSGAAAVGGLDVLLDQVGVEGEMTADYAAWSPEDFALALLGDPADLEAVRGSVGDMLQAWDIDFTGEVGGLVTLTFHYDPSLLPADFDETTLGVLHYTGGVWESLCVLAIDPEADTITVQTSGFSPFVLAVPEPSTAPALVIIGGLVMIRRWQRGMR
ncbi:MAG: DUF3466 family protein [Phycisphaeraceae bacterium]|nr:DUF3466 family protein [Phycisphaeraceae bacterium]